MTEEVEFISGFFAKAPRENAPDFVKAKVSLRRRDVLEWLAARQDDWINIDLKEASSGKWYASVDNWQTNEPDQLPAAPVQRTIPQADVTQAEDEFVNDDIPF